VWLTRKLGSGRNIPTAQYVLPYIGTLYLFADMGDVVHFVGTFSMNGKGCSYYVNRKLSSYHRECPQSAASSTLVVIFIKSIKGSWNDMDGTADARTRLCGLLGTPSKCNDVCSTC
jgi:hypothetical protein